MLVKANLEIQIITDGAVKKATWQPADNLSNQIFLLLAKKRFSMTNFTITVKPNLDTTYMIKETSRGDTKHIKVIRFNMSIQQN